MRTKAPETISATVRDLRDTAERLMKKAYRATLDDKADPLDAMLFSKSAGYLKGMANWLEQDENTKPAAANQPDPITLSDV